MNQNEENLRKRLIEIIGLKEPSCFGNECSRCYSRKRNIEAIISPILSLFHSQEKEIREEAIEELKKLDFDDMFNYLEIQREISEDYRKLDPKDLCYEWFLIKTENMRRQTKFTCKICGSETSVIGPEWADQHMENLHLSYRFKKFWKSVTKKGK